MCARSSEDHVSDEHVLEDHGRAVPAEEPGDVTMEEYPQLLSIDQEGASQGGSSSNESRSHR